ncbi:putative Armadillo-like helical protein, partial [Trachipleistophora hominis]
VNGTLSNLKDALPGNVNDHQTVINKEESKIDFKELTMDLSLIKDRAIRTSAGADVHGALKHVIYLLSKDDNKVRVHLVHNMAVLTIFGEEYVHEVIANLLRNMDDKNWRYRIALIDGLCMVDDIARYAQYFENDDVYFVRKYFRMVVDG